MAKWKAIIVEQPALIREGLKLLISSVDGVEVVGQVKACEEAIKLTEELMPDLVVIGFSLAGASGLEAVKEIKRRCPGVTILVFAAYEDKEHVKASLKAGCDGYLLTETSFDEFVMAVRTVLKGEVFVDPTILKPLIEESLHGRSFPQIFSKRERQILALIVGGRRNREIAEELRISPLTVGKHRSNLMKKVGVHNLSALITFAISKGFSVLPRPQDSPSSPLGRQRKAQ